MSGPRLASPAPAGPARHLDRAGTLGAGRRRGGRRLGRGRDERRAGRRRAWPAGAADQQGRPRRRAPPRWPRAAWPPRSARATARRCTSGTRWRPGPGCASPARWPRWSPRRPGEIARLAVLGARLDARPAAPGGRAQPEPDRARRRRRDRGRGAPGAAGRLLDSPVETLTRCAAVDVLTGAGRPGRRAAGRAGQPLTAGCGWASCTAPAVVLATGGFGQAFAHHHQPGRADRGRAGAGRPGRGRAARRRVRPVPPDRALAAAGASGAVPADHRGAARRRGGAGRRGRASR